MQQTCHVPIFVMIMEDPLRKKHNAGSSEQTVCDPHNDFLAHCPQYIESNESDTCCNLDKSVLSTPLQSANGSRLNSVLENQEICITPLSVSCKSNKSKRICLETDENVVLNSPHSGTPRRTSQNSTTPRRSFSIRTPRLARQKRLSWLAASGDPASKQIAYPMLGHCMSPMSLEDAYRILQGKTPSPLLYAAKRCKLSFVHGMSGLSLPDISTKNLPSEESNSVFVEIDGKETVNNETVVSSPLAGRNSEGRNLVNAIFENADMEEDELPSTQPVSSFILKDVIAFVDVRSSVDREANGVREQLKQLGATVSNSFNKKVTHVIFMNGLMSTYKKAVERSIPLVSVLWIEACKKAKIQLCERGYPALELEKYKSPDALKILRKGRFIPDLGVLKRRMLQKELKEKKNKEECGTGNEIPTQLQSDKQMEIVEDSVTKFTSLNDGFPENVINPMLQNSVNVINFRDQLCMVDRVLHSTETGPNNSLCDMFASISNVTQRRKRKLMNLSQRSALLVPNLDDQLQSVSERHVETPRKRRKVSTNSSSDYILETGKSSLENSGNNNSKLPCLTKQSRRSSFDFIPTQQRRSLRLLESRLQKAAVNHHPTIVCTSLQFEDVGVVLDIIKKLGKFKFERDVTSKTTHLVTNGVRRTLKLLKGMARGCWIVKLDWMFKSLEEGKWVDEEEFELTEFSHAVQQFRLEKLSFGPAYKSDLFSSCGPIFISNNCSPPKEDIADLVTLCGGIVLQTARTAKVIIGDDLVDETVRTVRAKWIFDSITCNTLQSLEAYIVKKAVM